MDQAFLLSEFDRLVSDGLVLYDDKQTVLRQQDGGVTVRYPRFQIVPVSCLRLD